MFSVGQANFRKNMTGTVVEYFDNVLFRWGFVPQHNKFIDLFARIKPGPAIFEAKSISPTNEREQIRHVISQVYEYRHLHSLKNATLVVVLSQKPTEE